jgi:hypothetical protein
MRIRASCRGRDREPTTTFDLQPWRTKSALRSSRRFPLSKQSCRVVEDHALCGTSYQLDEALAAEEVKSGPRQTVVPIGTVAHFGNRRHFATLSGMTAICAQQPYVAPLLQDGGPIAPETIKSDEASSTSPLNPAFRSGNFNLVAPSSERTGFRFERKHWCRCQRARDERVTQPPLRLLPIRGSSW